MIVDYQVLDNEQDGDVVVELADRILLRHKVGSWSFDKGFWKKENKELLQLEIPKVVMPKLGKRKTKPKNKKKAAPSSFKCLKSKLSAIESNINELENRGLDPCLDRGIRHYKRYISLGICAYNLKKIGLQILKLKREAFEAGNRQKQAA